VTLTVEAIMDELRQVPDPCSIAVRAPMDICEMGLVEEVEIEGSRVRVTLLLTDPSCVHFRPMQRYISDRVGALDGVDDVEVALSTESLWTPDRMRTAFPAR
jgi:metal-sulfur cluster biosynthetic enzyme